MKINSQRSKRTFIIIALCFILLLMGVGYAAFSSLLTINGTANISNSWCVGFDATKTSAMQITKGLDTGTQPTGTMGYSGNVCETNYKPSASLTASFYQPGDEIEYTLTIKNKSSITAAIKSININSDQNVVRDWTNTIGNFTYIVNMPEDTTLDSNEETTMKVIAKFQDDTPIVGTYTGETQSLNISINVEQDDGEGGMITNPKFTGTIYRWNANSLVIGDNINPTSFEGYAITNDGVYGHGPGGAYTTFESCIDDYLNKYHMSATSGYNCQAVTINKTGAGEYTTDASTLNKTYYLKHDVLEDEVTASYVCFVFNNTEHCMKGAVNEVSLESKPVFAANTQMIQEYQTFYSLNNVSNPSSSNPGCYFDSDYSYCYGGGFSRVDADSYGDVNVYGPSSEYCYVFHDGYSYCGK